MRSKITHEQFVTTWQKSKSIYDVGQKLGLSFDQTRNRAAYLRKMGVPLKKFPVGAPKKDFTPLIKLARSLAK